MTKKRRRMTTMATFNVTTAAVMIPTWIPIQVVSVVHSALHNPKVLLPPPKSTWKWMKHWDSWPAPVKVPPFDSFKKRRTVQADENENHYQITIVPGDFHKYKIVYEECNALSKNVAVSLVIWQELTTRSKSLPIARRFGIPISNLGMMAPNNTVFCILKFDFPFAIAFWMVL
jgi:hypothetical protein